MKNRKITIPRLDNGYNEYHVITVDGKSVKHGPTCIIDGKGVLRFSGFYVNGKRNGEFRKWYANGNPQYVAQFKDDQLTQNPKCYSLDSSPVAYQTLFSEADYINSPFTSNQTGEQ